MKAAPKKVLDEIIMDFIKQTSNVALWLEVCACCTRELNGVDTVNCSLSAIPNHHLLKPKEPHPEHDLFNGVLLEPSGINSVTSVRFGSGLGKKFKPRPVDDADRPLCVKQNTQMTGVRSRTA